MRYFFLYYKGGLYVHERLKKGGKRHKFTTDRSWFLFDYDACHCNSDPNGASEPLMYVGTDLENLSNRIKFNGKVKERVQWDEMR